MSIQRKLVLAISVAIFPSAMADQSMIHDASFRGDMESVRSIVQGIPAAANLRDSLGAGPLHFAALGGQHAVAEYLIAQKGVIDARDEFGCTPLHWAMRGGPRFGVTDPVMLGLVGIETGTGRRDTGGVDQELPWLQVTTLLLQRGADVNAVDRFGATPLHRAAAAARDLLVETLINGGADVNAADENGKTPLHWAAHDGNGPIAVWLLRKGASVDLKDKAGRTPLHDAVTFNKADFARLLITRGADVNLPDGDGQTPLMIATRESDEVMLELLRLNNARE